MLIVDDNRSARRALVQICQSLQWKTADASSAEEAYDVVCRAAADGNAFDLMLLDRWMPGQSGVDMLHRAAANPDISVPPVILMVRDDEGEKFKPLPDHGAIKSVITKPVTSSTIFDAAVSIRSGATLQRREVKAPLDGQLAGVRLLIVEDNQINMDFLLAILRRTGADVVTASDGLQAIATLRDVPDTADVVLMDVQMPDMDGYETTRVIRTQLGLRDLPIIALTANVMAEDRDRALAAGMNAHLGKPIDVDEMIAVILAQLPHFRPRPNFLPRAGQAEAMADQAGTSFRDLAVLLPGIDVVTAEAQFGGERATFLALLRRFASTNRHAVREVRAHLAADQPLEAARLLHKVRGVAANLGARALAQSGLEAEQAITGGRDAAATLDALETVHSAIVEAILALPDELADDDVDMRTAAAPKPLASASLDVESQRNRLTALAAMFGANDLNALSEFVALRTTLARLDLDATRVRVRTHIAMKRQADALRDTERKLAESFDLLRVTLESIAEAVITTDDRGHIVWLNSVAATMTGWTRDDARGQASTDVFTVIDAKTGHVRENPVQRCLAEGRRVILQGHATLASRDGRGYKIDTSVSPIRGGDGRLLGVVLVFRDVAEQNPQISPGSGDRCRAKVKFGGIKRSGQRV